jgi:hypothetical protein
VRIGWQEFLVVAIVVVVVVVLVRLRRPDG